MSLYGLDEEKETVEETISTEKDTKKRRPFAYWEVGGKSHKLKLTTTMICKLEDKYKMNLLNIIDEMPPLSVMLTIIQAAMTPWEHGVKFRDVQAMYDQYADEGGSQFKLFSDVIMGIMTVSGFFTQSQAENLKEALKEADELL